MTFDLTSAHTHVLGGVVKSIWYAYRPSSRASFTKVNVLSWPAISECFSSFTFAGQSSNWLWPLLAGRSDRNNCNVSFENSNVDSF